jgi:hypothetical protein
MSSARSMTGRSAAVKALWIAVATVWFGAWTVCSYRVFASSRPLPVELESESPLRQIKVSTPSPALAPRRAFTPEQLLGAVPTGVTLTRERSPGAATRLAPRTGPSSPAPSLTPPPTQNSTRTDPIAEPSPVESRCQVCDEPVYSWVERDGRRYGYCQMHQGQSTSATLAPAGATAALKQQCLGTTKSGSRCRRKTTDPSGWCYQHKPQ